MSKHTLIRGLTALGVVLAAVGFLSLSTQSQTVNMGRTYTSSQNVRYANEGGTGTTLNKLAKLTGAPSTAIITATVDTSGIVGIVVAGAGAAGNADIAFSGKALCVFDSATTAGHYVQNDTSTAGDCMDAGASYPTSGQVIGVVTSTNGGAGTYEVDLTLGQPQAGGSASGTFRIPVLGWQVLPDSSGNIFFQPYAVTATNDVWKHGHWIFANVGAARINLYGVFNVPHNYTGTAKIVIVWTSTVTAGSAVWDFDYRAIGGDDAESLDQAGTQESVTVTDAAPGAANNRLVVTIDLTSANFAADDTVEYLISRDLSDAADDLAGSVQIVDLLFQYVGG